MTLVGRHWQQQVIRGGALKLDHLAGDLGEQGMARLEVDDSLLLVQPLAGQQEGCLAFHHVSLQALLGAMNAHIHLHLAQGLATLVVAEHKVLADLLVQVDLVLGSEADPPARRARPEGPRHPLWTLRHHSP